jgi:superfamily I DNA/RNA helicase
MCIDNDIIVTKEFHEKVSSLYHLGGRNRNIYARVQSLLGGIKEEGERAFNQFPVSNNGESRIKSCVKYRLDDSYRLVTVKRDLIIWLLYVGNHDDTDRWITRNSGWTPIRGRDGEIRIINRPMDGDGPFVSGLTVPGSQKLVERLEKPLYYARFLELLPSIVAIQIAAFDGHIDESHIKSTAAQILDHDLKNTVIAVLIALLQDKQVEAHDLIDCHLGAAVESDNWNPADYIKIKRNDGFVSVKENTAEYEEALNDLAQRGSSLDWLLFMHPEQSKVVETDFDGPAQLSGVSGSGKTCVAIKRALRLAEQNPDAKVLIVTLNKSLVGLIKQLLTLAAKSPDLLAQIEITSMFELNQKLIVEVGGRDIRLFGELTDRLNEDIDKVFREYYRQWLNNTDANILLHIHKILTSNGINAERYIHEEFDWIRSAFSHEEREKYLEEPRVGRKFQFLKEVKGEILQGLKLWEKKMNDVGIVDYLGLTAEVHNFIEKLKPEYDHVLIDESQDFGTTELAIIKLLTKDGTNNLFLCGDVAQSVLPKQRSLKKANIMLAGRREKIIKNYRNTRQILRLAYDILVNNLSEDQFSAADDALEILDPQYANRSLNDPVLLKANSLAEEVTYAKKMLEDLCYSNENHNGCIVLAGFKSSEVKVYSEKIGVPVLDGNLDPLNEPLVLSDLEQAKGYEFDAVVIVNCEKGILPLEGTPEDEQYRSACQLYVSMTRAKNDLYLSYHNRPSSWLEHTSYLYSIDWSEAENISDVNLLDAPERLSETHEPEVENDIFIGMTGLEFVYSEHSLGLSVEHQEKLIDLVDGRGMYSASRKVNTRWKDMRNLMRDLEIDPKVRLMIGPILTEKL